MKYNELRLLYDSGIIDQEEFFTLNLSLPVSSSVIVTHDNIDLFPEYENFSIVDKTYLFGLIKDSNGPTSIKVHKEHGNDERTFIFITCNIIWLREVLNFIHCYNSDKKINVFYYTNPDSHKVNSKIIIFK